MLYLLAGVDIRCDSVELGLPTHGVDIAKQYHAESFGAVVSLDLRLFPRPRWTTTDYFDELRAQNLNKAWKLSIGLISPYEDFSPACGPETGGLLLGFYLLFNSFESFVVARDELYIAFNNPFEVATPIRYEIVSSLGFDVVDSSCRSMIIGTKCDGTKDLRRKLNDNALFELASDAYLFAEKMADLLYGEHGLLHVIAIAEINAPKRIVLP